jgi:hypothetical protein
MSTVTVPSYLAEGRRKPFPPGLWMGKFAPTESSWSEDGKDHRLRVTLTDMTKPETGEKSPRDYTFTIVVVQNGVSILQVTDFDDETVAFPLRRSAGLVASLAAALGQAAVTPQGVQVDMNAFLTALADNQFVGLPVMVEVGNRTYTSKRTNQEVVDDSPIRFGAST